jgi:hypothetical protein
MINNSKYKHSARNKKSEIKFKWSHRKLWPLVSVYSEPSQGAASFHSDQNNNHKIKQVKKVTALKENTSKASSSF